MRAWVWMLKAEAANKRLRPRMLGAFSVAYPTATSQGNHNSCGVFGSGLLLLYAKKLQIPRGQSECFLSRCRRDLMMSVLVTQLTAADCG